MPTLVRLLKIMAEKSVGRFMRNVNETAYERETWRKNSEIATSYADVLLV